MRYTLLLHHPEPTDGEVSDGMVARTKEAFGAFGRGFDSESC